MLRVYLRKTENFTIGKFPAHFPAHIVEVINFVFVQCKPLLLIISLNIIDQDNGFRLFIGSKNILIKLFINPLKHWIVFRNFTGRKIFFYPGNAGNSHILSNLHSTCTPGCDHLASRTGKFFVYLEKGNRFRLTEQPNQSFLKFILNGMYCINGNDALRRSSEKSDHMSLSSI